ncbi:hypothetical protein ND2E_2242 [Colwellia psychrerythraea]|uniref:Uncharacterized protein n=1 Tax=Colwellia psychrerythraea TaxID=28229 RepID=A0A099KV23_COLPS|nr:hypothetical protein ND2E_2242 [Colwellia psychrerythraea]
MGTTKGNNYYKLFIVSIKYALYFIVPLTVLIFCIELGFELNDGGSIGLFFTKEFITTFIFHELMFIFYFGVFLIVFIIRLLLTRLEKKQ